MMTMMNRFDTDDKNDLVLVDIQPAHEQVPYGQRDDELYRFAFLRGDRDDTVSVSFCDRRDSSN